MPYISNSTVLINLSHIHYHVVSTILAMKGYKGQASSSGTEIHQEFKDGSAMKLKVVFTSAINNIYCPAVTGNSFKHVSLNSNG